FPKTLLPTPSSPSRLIITWLLHPGFCRQKDIHLVMYANTSGCPSQIIYLMNHRYACSGSWISVGSHPDWSWYTAVANSSSGVVCLSHTCGTAFQPGVEGLVARSGIWVLSRQELLDC